MPDDVLDKLKNDLKKAGIIKYFLYPDPLYGGLFFYYNFII